jgi:hypothetical protein
VALDGDLRVRLRLADAVGEGVEVGAGLGREAGLVEPEPDRAGLALRRLRPGLAEVLDADPTGAAVLVRGALEGNAAAAAAAGVRAALVVGLAGDAGAALADLTAGALGVRLAAGGNAAGLAGAGPLSLEAGLAVGVDTTFLAEAVHAHAGVAVLVAVLGVVALRVRGWAGRQRQERREAETEEKDARFHSFLLLQEELEPVLVARKPQVKRFPAIV